MTFDLFLLAVAALFAVYGYASGAIKQLSHWAGVILAYSCARPATVLAAPLIAKAIEWPASTVGTVLSCGLFFAFLLIGNELSRYFLLKFFRGRENGPADGAAGAVLGFGKAAAVLFAVLSALLYFDKPRAKPANGYDAAMKSSIAVAFVGRHNLFANLNIPAPAEPLIKPSRRASKRRASAAP